MAAKETTKASDRGSESKALYVYGVVPADVQLTEDARGLGDREIKLVRCGDIAAMVSEIEVKDAIGRPEDLTAHQRTLDATVTEVPVLPFRFGAVLTGEEAVTEELLRANHDEFSAALKELEGRVEYVVNGRYNEKTVLREVVEQNEQAARLRDEIRDADETVTRDQRMRLGEIVYGEIQARREVDTQELADELADRAVEHTALEPTHEYDAARIAFLVETSKAEEFEEAVQDLTKDWKGRAELRLLGPLAPYDFVLTQG